MTSDDQGHLIITLVPALVALLLNLEKAKGEPLTEAEVLHARDNAASIALPRKAHEALIKSRGYPDIDPERAWEEWLAFKAEYPQLFRQSPSTQ
jgi:hypothetical protein